VRQGAQPRSHRAPKGRRRAPGAQRQPARAAASQRRRAPTTAVLTAFGVVALGLATVGGFVACGRASGAADLGSAAGLRALADRLQHADEATYTAEYLVGGSTVVHAQAPPRQAFRSAGVVLTISPDTIVTCAVTTTTGVLGCQRSPGMDGMALTEARMVTKATTAGFVAPGLVVSALLRAAARPSLRVTTRRRTIGGTRAECATVAAAAVRPPSASAPLGELRFTACVTEAGVLAGFEGTFEGASTGRMTLERYLPSVTADAFDLPSGATVAEVEAAGQQGQ
jgi:hypothetical protein